MALYEVRDLISNFRPLDFFQFPIGRIPFFSVLGLLQKRIFLSNQPLNSINWEVTKFVPLGGLGSLKAVT